MFGKYVEDALNELRKNKDNCQIPDAEKQSCYKMISALDGLWKEVHYKVCALFLREMDNCNPNQVVWWFSVLLAVCRDKNLFKSFIIYVKTNQEKFALDTRFFLFYQFKSMAFLYSELDAADVKRELWEFYYNVIDGYKKTVREKLEYIPAEKRNKNLIVVITEQFLEEQHGPTKTALDRCNAIMEKLGKEVLLINTAEILSDVGAIDFLNGRRGSYFDKLMDEQYITWKGVDVPYYQCENNMPNIDELERLITIIREYAPSRVVSIGGSGVLCNLVNCMIPVLTVGLCPSDLEYTTNAYQTLGRMINERDVKLLEALNLRRSHVIESIFTSSLKPQTEFVARKDLGISEDAFVIAVVGARLDIEVTDEFLNMLEICVRENILVTFWGVFDNYNSVIEKYPKLHEHSRFMGFCMDILSRMENVDLYVNPKRKGGGTSCVEAMYKGVPVVTVDYGDVGVNVGRDFCVKDYEDMSQMIDRYRSDKAFYKKMSEKAVERTTVLLDTESEFVRILGEVDKREANEYGVNFDGKL